MGETLPDYEEVRGAGKPGRDRIPVPTANESRLASLLEERRGYAIARDNGEELRYGADVATVLAAIDSEIRSLGGSVPDDRPAPARAGRKPASGW